MMKHKTKFLGIVFFVGVIVVPTLTVVYKARWLTGQVCQETALVKEALAAGRSEVSPVKAIQDREVYYPGTEDGRETWYI